MSLVFNAPTTKNGIIQKIERLLFPGSVNPISGNTTRLAEFTAEVNLALDAAIAIIIPASGKWQFDDTNHEDMPIMMTNLVSGQRDYTFLADGLGNLVLDIYKVFVKDENGTYIELKPVDQQSEEGLQKFTDGRDVTGIPQEYDKTGNSIIFDFVPSYSQTNGVKVMINREGSYFTVADTTKKPGFAGLFHEYLAIHAAWAYALGNTLASFNDLATAKTAMAKEMGDYYGVRERDRRKKLSPKITPFR